MYFITQLRGSTVKRIVKEAWLELVKSCKSDAGCYGFWRITNTAVIDVNEYMLELEKERDDLKIQVEVLTHSDAQNYELYCELLFSPNEPHENLEGLKLKWQAEGIKNFFKKHYHQLSDARLKHWADLEVKSLINQAKGGE
jgi:hypothetical protein